MRSAEGDRVLDFHLFFMPPYAIMQMMLFRRSSKLTAAALLLTGAGLTGLLAGCGTQAQNALKVQEDLSEAQRLVQTQPTDAEARQWADRAVAVAPSDAGTYFGGEASTGFGDSVPILSVYSVFNDAGDTPAVADYMTQATKKFPSDERGFLLLSQAQKTLGQAAAQKATAAQLVLLLNRKIRTPGATNLDASVGRACPGGFRCGRPGRRCGGPTKKPCRRTRPIRAFQTTGPTTTPCGEQTCRKPWRWPKKPSPWLKSKVFRTRSSRLTRIRLAGCSMNRGIMLRQSRTCCKRSAPCRALQKSATIWA